MEGPIAPPPGNPMQMAMLTNLTKTMTTMLLLVLQMHLLISPQINLLPSSHPTNLHHNSPLHSSLFQMWPQPHLHQPSTSSQIIHQQMVNWSHFKPEFKCKPEEDAEAHLLCTNDWMQTHNFGEKCAW